MAKTSKATKKVREDLSGIDFEFAHGAVLEINLDDLSEEVQTNLMLHGLSQKIGDSYSGSKDSEEAFKFAAGTVQRLKDGEWKAAREGGGVKRTTILVEALERVFPDQSQEACQDKVAAMSDEQIKGLKAHPQIKAAIAAITAERAIERAKKDAAAAADAGGDENEALAF